MKKKITTDTKPSPPVPHERRPPGVVRSRVEGDGFRVPNFLPCLVPPESRIFTYSPSFVQSPVCRVLSFRFFPILMTSLLNRLNSEGMQLKGRIVSAFFENPFLEADAPALALRCDSDLKALRAALSDLCRCGVLRQEAERYRFEPEAGVYGEAAALAGMHWEAEAPVRQQVVELETLARLLEALVRQASETEAGDERMAAVAELKAMRMCQQVAHVLCDCVRTGAHPAWRATAAGALGYHGAAAAFPELQEALLAHAREEPDLVVAKAIAFALRDTQEALALLDHGQVGVAAEAVLGVTLSEVGWTALMARFFDGVDGQVEALMLRRVQAGEEAVARVVSFLLTADFPEDRVGLTPRVFRLFGALPQPALFAALVGVEEEIRRTHKEIWPGIQRRGRKRALMEIFEDRVREDGASEALLEALLERTVEDEGFWDRYLRFVRSLLRTLDAEGTDVVMDRVERIAGEINREEIARLAEFLVALVQAVPATGLRVQKVLGRWEAILPGVQVKAFHARLGAG